MWGGGDVDPGCSILPSEGECEDVGEIEEGSEWRWGVVSLSGFMGTSGDSCGLLGMGTGGKLLLVTSCDG